MAAYLVSQRQGLVQLYGPATQVGLFIPKCLPEAAGGSLVTDQHERLLLKQLLRVETLVVPIRVQGLPLGNAEGYAAVAGRHLVHFGDFYLIIAKARE